MNFRFLRGRPKNGVFFSAELERVQSGRKGEEKRTVEVTKEKSIKVTVKVQVPVREHPKVRLGTGGGMIR